MLGEKGRDDQTWEGEIVREREEKTIVKKRLFRFEHFPI